MPLLPSLHIRTIPTRRSSDLVTEARVGEARSGYYPQVQGRLAYQRATANIATSFGGGPVTRNTRGDTFGTYLNNATLNQTRSEEHTSELQSRLHLVCRLLLEK